MLSSGHVVVFPLTFGLQRWLLARSYRRQPSLHGSQVLRFGREGISASSPEARGELDWSIWTSWREDEELFLLYEAAHLFVILPKRWFQGDEERIGAFRRLLQEKLDGRH